MLARLPFEAGAAPLLFPVDALARHGAARADLDARRASPGVVAACAELRGLARERLRRGGAAARDVAAADPAGLRSRSARCGSISTGWSATARGRSTRPPNLRRSAGSGRSGAGREGSEEVGLARGAKRTPSPACWGRWREAPDGVWKAGSVRLRFGVTVVQSDPRLRRRPTPHSAP